MRQEENLNSRISLNSIRGLKVNAKKISGLAGIGVIVCLCLAGIVGGPSLLQTIFLATTGLLAVVMMVFGIQDPWKANTTKQTQQTKLQKQS